MMKRLNIFTFALLTAGMALSAPLVLAQAAAPVTSTWQSDTAHSEVDFSIKHLSVSNVHGRFGKVDAKIVLNEADITKSTVTAMIDVSTVDTGEPKRDAHLKTPDFFDASSFPLATFTSTSVSRNGSHLTVMGNFTLHGVTKPITLDVEGPATPATGMDHKLHSGFEATTIISRTAFGIGSSYPELALSDAVKLTIELEVVKQS